MMMRMRMLNAKRQADLTSKTAANANISITNGIVRTVRYVGLPVLPQVRSVSIDDTNRIVVGLILAFEEGDGQYDLQLLC